MDKKLRQSLQGLIGLYQKLSRLWPKRCRFYPSCSCYAHQALESYGLLRASALIIRRLLKCQPFHPGGVDFLPSHSPKL